MREWANDQPLISVLLPIYNMEDYLSECIDSLLNQTYAHFELILVDDGSTDNTAVLCDTYAQKDSRILVVHQKNGGVSAARNTAVELASGEYITQVDPDDWVAPEYLERLLDLCLKYRTTLSSCNHIIFRSNKENHRFSSKTGERLLTAHEACENILYHDVPDVCAWGKLYHRSLAQHLHYPAGKVYEDTYAIAPVLLAAQVISYTSEPLYFYRIRGTSISRGTLKDEKLLFIPAVEYMTECILRAYPDLHNGALRRKVHAALSTRRYLVKCEKSFVSYRNQLELFIKENAHVVLTNKRTPKRDKLAILAICCGSWVYDLLWGIYEHVRG